jgi:hypothetical protein
MGFKGGMDLADWCTQAQLRLNRLVMSSIDAIT